MENRFQLEMKSLPHQPVPHPWHGQNQGRAAGVEFDLFAQATDVDVDGALALDARVVAPDSLDDLAPPLPSGKRRSRIIK